MRYKVKEWLCIQFKLRIHNFSTFLMKLPYVHNLMTLLNGMMWALGNKKSTKNLETLGDQPGPSLNIVVSLLAHNSLS